MGKLIAIVGPTAGGKTALAVELARKFDGEIICADSRTVYKGLDIGTAKPTAEERALVPHHLLDVVEPDEPFTAADFKRLANEAITDIAARGKLPLLTGGSGLYVDAVLYDYGFSKHGSKRDSSNPRHLHREVPRLRKEIRPETLVIGLEVLKGELARRIAQRVDAMVDAGLIDEVKHLKRRYPGSKALLAPGYKAFAEYIDGAVDIHSAKADFVRNDLQLAKRQRTWFKRNNSIQWVDGLSKAVEIATTFLAKN